MEADSDHVPTPWDFRPVRQFLRAFDPESETSAKSLVLNPALYDPKSAVPKSLGDFERFFTFFSKPLEAPLPKSPRTSNDSSSARSTGSTPPSSAPDDDAPLKVLEDYDSKAAGKEVRWSDQLGKNLTEVRRKSTHGYVGDIDAAVVARLLEDDGYESDIEEPAGFLEQPLRSPTFHRQADLPVFLPASVAPPKRPVHSRPPPPIPNIHVDPSIILPLYTLTINKQKAKLVKKLIKRFLGEMDIVNSVPRLGNKHDDGIHIFVDCSNIVIGFYNRLKVNRRINPAVYVKQPPISYHSLALILERGRAVKKRILVGSNPRHYASERGLPDYMQEAQLYGYEINMLERVQKMRRFTPRKKKNGSGNGYATTSGQSSGSETVFSGVPIVAEQGVDEILQMKLLESLVDTQKPSTIVLASGDAAEAEFSGGFLKCVERALSKGWKVEVIAWKDGLSQEYRSQRFVNKWRDHFTIIELDDFCEEMLAVYISKPTSA